MGCRRERKSSAAGKRRAWARREARLRARLLWRGLGRLAREDEGQATLEYILILAAAVVGAGLMSRQILNAIDDGIVRLGAQLEKDLKTGRVVLDIWKN
jgi:hypothetical protein